MTENEKTFSTPEDCLRVIETLETSGLLRAQDRAMIHDQFNGNPPYTKAEVKANHISFNVNDLSGYRMAIDGNAQVNGALMNKDRFFNARCVKGKPEKREEYSQKFTENIHVPLKRGRSGKKYLHLMQNRNASLVLDGIGAMVWMNDYCWMPKFVALQDLLIPEDTSLDLDDELGHFAYNVYLTPWQLAKLIKGPKVDKGWNKSLAKRVIASIPKVSNQLPGFRDTTWKPEAWESLLKQHATFLNSDAAGKVKLTFLFEQDSEDGKWYRKVIYRKSDDVTLDEKMPDEQGSKFLYDGGKTPFADSIGQILHVQFGNGNVVAPLKFHSVRGLGILLFAVVEALNRMYCQTLQASFFDMMQIFRITNPGQQDRPKVIDLHNWGSLEEGVSFVKSDERHKPDTRLMEMASASSRQLLSESGSAYVQDIDTGTQKEQTLGEAQIKLQSANKVVGSMLSNMYWQEVYLYEEEKRRFLMKNPTDPDIVEFQKKCKADGIPDELMVADAWVVDVEKVFGQGDQTLAIQEVTALMAAKAQYDSTAQRKILKKYTATITRNHDLATDLVPDQPNQSTSGRRAAEAAFPLAMMGIPPSLVEGIEQQDYIIAMAEMMSAKIERIKATSEGNMGTPDDVIGLQTVGNDILAHLQLLEQNPAMKPLVSGMTKEVGSMMNEVKAFAQRQQQAAEAKAAESQQDPEAMAKVQALQATTQTKQQAAMATTTQKLSAANAKHAQEMKQAQEKHEQEMADLRAATSAEIASLGAKTEAEIASKAATTKADIAAKEAQAKAAPKKSVDAKPSGGA